MEKKALQIASVASMIDQFNISNIMMLRDLGYKVDVVADFTTPGTITVERANNLKKHLNNMGVRVIDIAIPRSLNPKAVTNAYKKVKKLISSEHYDLIHCHSPIGGVICRQAAKDERKKGTRVIYTAHGFHFYDGAPVKNWFVFYPIEKWYSRYTDVLITINTEDYKRASEKFHAGKTVKIPGVGVDTEKFAVCRVDKCAKRRELGVKDEDFLLLSVVETSNWTTPNIVIDALGKMRVEGTIDNIVYLIVAQEDMQEKNKLRIKQYGLRNNIRLLGFRTDIDELCETVNCFVHTSMCEGLIISLLEAMATGLPLITINDNGIRDYTEDGVSGCYVSPTDVNAMAKAIKRIHTDKAFRDSCASNNYKKAKTFNINNTDEIMKRMSINSYRHLESIIIRQKKRKELGLQINDYVLISVGELNNNKNHQTVIKAISELPTEIKYVLVGKGPLEMYLKKLTEDIGVGSRVIITGYRTDIKELLWMSDCFVFPSKREGLGLAALEGMASGLPVIGRDIGGIRDYVVDNISGFLCRSDNDFLDKIKKARAKNWDRKKLLDIVSEFDKSYTDALMKDIYTM